MCTIQEIQDRLEGMKVYREHLNPVRDLLLIHDLKDRILLLEWVLNESKEEFTEAEIVEADIIDPALSPRC